MTSLNEYIIDIATEKLEAIIHKKYTEEEEIEYYASQDYELHLNYLIETWVSHIEKQFKDDYEIKYNIKDFNIISTLFEYGDYHPYFDNEWLDDIFVRHILVTPAVCLK